jgi:hypothetical protein
VVTNVLVAPAGTGECERSIGSTSIRKTVVDGVTFAERWLLDEVSIVRKGANPDCVLEIMRND